MPSCILFLPTVTMDISETREYVRATLRHESEPLWFPQLVGPIGRVAWNRLSRQIGLTSKSYSTTRLVLRDPKAKHHIVRYCGPKSGQGRDCMPGLIPVEVLTADVMQKITDHDVRLLQPHLLQGSVAAGLDAAFSLLELVPTIGATIHELVKALHVIDSCDDDTDVSFSDPALPFSVFVSVPRRKSVTASWRIAEAILHESMHLHLTLVGQVLPLLHTQRNVYYSPWRREQRSAEGILQALYVFGVIRSFFTVLPTLRSSAANNHVASRTKEIESQMRLAQAFRGCDELTADGEALVARLLDTIG